MRDEGRESQSRIGGWIVCRPLASLHETKSSRIEWHMRVLKKSDDEFWPLCPSFLKILGEQVRYQKAGGGQMSQFTRREKKDPQFILISLRILIWFHMIFLKFKLVK